MASDATAGALAAAPSPRGDLRNYALVTGAYWTDTLVDGARRTLVLFYFDKLGYSPVQVASLFIAARRALRDGLAGALRCGKGLDEDELQERGEARRARERSVGALPLGGDPHRLQECAEGNRLLSRSAAAERHWLSRGAADPRGDDARRARVELTAHARASRKARQGRKVPPDVLQQLCRQRAGGRPHLPVRCARRVVRRRSPVLPLLRAGLVLLASGSSAAVWVIGYGAVQAAAPRFVRSRASDERAVPDGRSALRLSLVLALCPAAIVIALGPAATGQSRSSSA
jgi:hypothetical protein